MQQAGAALTSWLQVSLQFQRYLTRRETIARGTFLPQRKVRRRADAQFIVPCNKAKET
jgi:hypothetical protein